MVVPLAEDIKSPELAYAVGVVPNGAVVLVTGPANQ